MTVFWLAAALMAVCIALRRPLLHLVFGQVEADVMTNADVYFLITALSYPFVALYNAGAALFRASGNSRLPMQVSTVSNFLNIIGNAIMIFGFHKGVAGDVRFSMILTMCTMWTCRVLVVVILARCFGFGPIAVWIGVFIDWGVRGIFFFWRFFSGKWMEKKVL